MGKDRSGDAAWKVTATVRLMTRAARRILVQLPRSSRYSALASLVLGLAAGGVVPTRPALGVGVGVAAIGLAYLLGEARTAARRRREADELLLALPTATPPPKLAWRARELTAPRYRQVLARSLRRLVDRAAEPAVLSSMPVNRRVVWPNRKALVALADRLAAVDRPVHPRGVVLVRELITDGLHSPLYDDDADGLREALERTRRAIEPR